MFVRYYQVIIKPLSYKNRHRFSDTFSELLHKNARVDF